VVKGFEARWVCARSQQPCTRPAPNPVFHQQGDIRREIVDFDHASIGIDVNFTSRESHGSTQLVKLRRNAESFDDSEVGVFSKEPRTLAWFQVVR
jgi:hypothetical protein